MKEELIKLGLEEAEAEVYLQLLKGKNQTANQIAKETNLNRSVTYTLLDRLLEKSLVSYVLINNIRHFSANNPDSLTYFLEEKRQILKKLLPDLNNIREEKQEKVSVEVFQGLNSGVAIMKDVIREGKGDLSLGEDGSLQSISQTMVEQYVRDLNTKKIKERILAKEGTKLIKSKYTYVKYLPKEFELPTITTIYGDKVAIGIFEKPYYIILIKSKTLAETYQSFFESLWKIAKK